MRNILFEAYMKKISKKLYDRNEQKNLILVNVENPLPEEYSVDLSEIAEGVMVAVPGCAGVWIHKTLSTR